MAKLNRNKPLKKAPGKTAKTQSSSSPLTTPAFNLYQWTQSKMWFLLGGVMLLALILRVQGLGRLSFWFDEFLHVLPASDLIEGRGLQHIDGLNGVFTTWTQIVFLSIFGVSEWAARFPMVLFSVATLIPLFFITQKLFNTRVALTASLLYALSVYSIFWGRVVRNYATFLPFFLWMQYLILLIFEPDISQKNGFQIQNKPRFSLRNLLLLLGVFVLSILNHQLTVMGIIAWVFFGTLCWTLNAIQYKKGLLNRYTLFVPLFLSFGLLFTSWGNVLAKKVLALLLPPNIVAAVVPDLSRILALTSEKPFAAFTFYFDVIQNDFWFLYIPALIGLIAMFKNHKRSGLFVWSQFVWIFLLLCFVFREPLVTRYLYFIYPFYLMAAAYGIWFVLEWISSKMTNVHAHKSLGAALLVVVASIALSKPNQTRDFLTRSEHGQALSNKLAEWYFTNWRKPMDFVRENYQEGDVILSTVPNAVRLYMGIDTSRVGWFRQMRYDPEQKAYVENEPTGKPVSGYTLDELKQTMEKFPRGWLLADYYFHNVMTSDQAKEWVIQNMEYHFAASPDGSVHVFSWDNNKPQTQQNYIFAELGKPLGRSESDEYQFQYQRSANPKAMLYFEIEGLNSDKEAAFTINNSSAIFIQKEGQSWGMGREIGFAEIDASILKEGTNMIKFYHNPEVKETDYNPGFVVYNLVIR